MPTERSTWMIPQPLRAEGLRCLLLGIKGAGMTAVAEILRDARHQVFGIDDSLQRAGSGEHLQQFARIIDWQADVVLPRFDLCVTSRAIPSEHPLLQQLRSSGTQILTLPTFLARTFAGKRQLCVAGTHGKSTTSAMLTWILQQAGRDPCCFVGAHQLNFNASGRESGSSWAVLESCEFSRSFVEFSPNVALITGIERDHFDCFPEQESEDDAFRAFADRLPADGVLVYRADCLRSVGIAEKCSGPRLTFAADDVTDRKWTTLPDFRACDIRLIGTSSRCRIHHAEQFCRLRLNVPGRHNILNAVAAIAAAHATGVPVGVSCAALATFAGIQRRFEIRGDYDGMTLIDDYAHHPTAIRATLETARAAFPGARIIVAFEPHQIVRTKALFADFVNSLKLADEILVLPVFPARELVTHLECCRLSGRIVKELNRSGSRAFLFANLDQVVSRIDHSGRPSDILLTMGAGRTHLIHDQLTQRLQRHSVA